MKYIQKPLEVDARQLTEENGENLEAWVSDVEGWGAKYWPSNKHAAIVLPTKLIIFAPTGYFERKKSDVRVGDWIVRIGDTFHVYDENEFDERFEKVQ
jgi:hypothetical protein